MESWEDGSAIHELVLAIPDGLIPGMHRHGLSVWVNNPDCLSAGPDVVRHLCCDLPGAVVRGKNLDRQVRRTGEEADGPRGGDAGWQNHRNVRRPGRRPMPARGEA